MNKQELGWKKVDELGGTRGIKAIKAMEDASPRLARLALEFGYADVYENDNLDVKQRALVTLSSLISQGDAGRGLHYHFYAALNVGLKQEEVLEVINHCSAYVGFPKAIHALHIFQEVAEEFENNN
ncbi:carboxymuconolactone decarboxylase family protein [Gracilibacillus caseinilyticus]|uniref:Carboxymuconolactone decarboxylase family protein n=1 Tax=Gracilibacillus caseinilyticus TaxID=2932256 RepID=A0ABY4EYG7_9BACI|nr:carboxymuconolactone decarboxylase family protein [Gracilibacillus caseinilyticus]UOQ48942.1 carboxymuconolactone decarboxylase family protein [Gracilibacillus caseinilyticus]